MEGRGRKSIAGLESFGSIVVNKSHGKRKKRGKSFSTGEQRKGKVYIVRSLSSSSVIVGEII